ncbi:MAG: serine hydroxymethyltransferase [bacterium]|nr:serine hydroxymethyltransferase [bacterium]
MKDKQIKELIEREGERQKTAVNLIASENFASADTLDALGSVFTNKYAEGYPRGRYYGGNEVVDELEILCRKRALKLFNLSPKKWSVNVQPYSGSPANLAVYLGIVPKGGKIMGMTLEMGGHLTHGQKVSITGKIWKQIPYGVDKETERLDYEKIMSIAKKEKPFLIIAGATSYSRKIDFRKFRAIADEAGAYLMADISHIAGLIAGGAHPSPFPYADVVTTTTHKTLRGPRGALIFARKSEMRNSALSLADAVDKAVFPGIQGGPHMNQVAAIAVALEEAASPSFKKYAGQVMKNARVLADELKKKGWRIVSGGTDTHLFLVDTFEKGVSGKRASDKLEEAGIIVNKNVIPFDSRKPFDPSGIRVGTSAATTAGMKEKDMRAIAKRMDEILKHQ